MKRKMQGNKEYRMSTITGKRDRKSIPLQTVDLWKLFLNLITVSNLTAVVLFLLQNISVHGRLNWNQEINPL